MSNLYADIARRTGGDIYIGVVGPVRTGKSTLIKRIMEELVIPNIEDLYQRERARDELPQSGSGRTIMTAEPKFVPEEAVEITPDGTARLSVRLIDSVGYLVDGAIGATENGQPRMVTTPWADTELPMEEAAELGTRKVMEEHSTVGLVVTTDGSITDIPRADYREAEARAIRDMQATGKPFLVVVNSAAPNGGQAQALRCELEETYGVHAVTADCQSLHEAELGELLRALLYTFPMREVRVFLPAGYGRSSWSTRSRRRSMPPCGRMRRVSPASRMPSRRCAAPVSWSRSAAAVFRMSILAAGLSPVSWSSARGCFTRSSASAPASPWRMTASSCAC